VDRIRGFAWAVARALSAAVSACRFEQGDVLYDDPAGYGPWRGAGDAPASIIQVLDPPRSARTPTGDSEGGRFQTSWLLPVTLEDLRARSGWSFRVSMARLGERGRPGAFRGRRNEAHGS